MSATAAPTSTASCWALYDDRYVRVEGEWRFSSRILHAHHNGSPDLTADFADPC